MTSKSPIDIIHPPCFFPLLARMAILLSIALATCARGDEVTKSDILLGVGEVRQINLPIPWKPHVPQGTVFTQVVSITAAPEGVVSLDPPGPVNTTDGNVVLNVTGLVPGRTTLSPNNLPATNLAVTVVDVRAEILLSGCDEYQWITYIYGATNLWGGCGTLQIVISPPDQLVTLTINDCEWPLVKGTATIPLDSADATTIAVYLDNDPLRNKIYEETVFPVYGGYCGDTRGDTQSSSSCGCSDCGDCVKEAGELCGGFGSAWIAMSLGWSDARNSDGLLYFHKPTGPLGLDRSDFKLIAPASTHAEYDLEGRLKAVNTDTHRFVIVGEGTSLRIDVTNNVRQALVAQCTLSNPGGDPNSLEIAGGRLDASRHFGFTWNPATQSMAFRRGAASDADRIIETMTVYTNEYDTLTIDRRVTDANGALLRYTTTEYTEIGGVRLPTMEKVHSGPVPNEWDFSHTSWMGYHENPEHPGSYRKLAWRESDDGSSGSYEYDEKGRVTEHRSPWRSSGTRITLNSYTPVAGSGDNGTIEPHDLRQVIEKVDNTVIGRSYTVYQAVAGQPQQYRVIRERASSAVAGYNVPGNLRNETVYWWTNALAHLKGRPVLTLQADGRRTSYAYELGYLTVTHNTNDPATSTMTYTNEGAGIAVLRTVAIDGTAASTNGIPAQTTIDVTISDLAWGNTYISERYVRTESANLIDPDNRIDRTLTFYDAERHPVLTLNADGTYSESTWGCCGRESETGRDGIATDFTYDGQQRLVIQSDARPSFLPGSPGETTIAYTYDALGRTIETIRSATDQTSLTSTVEFSDLIGDNMLRTDEAGITSNTEMWPWWNWYGSWVQKETGYYDTYRLLALDGTVEVVETIYYCWPKTRVKQSEFNSFYNGQGCLNDTVTERGGWCSFDYLAYQPWDPANTWDPDPPCFEVSHRRSDFLGRTDYEAVPAYGGVLRETYSYYDSAGRLTNATVKIGTSVDERTLYQYNTLGNLALTCQDIDLDGQIDLDDPDRVSGQFGFYEYRAAETLHGQSVDAGWWQVSGSFVYPDENGSTPLTNGLSRTRLSGLGQAGPYGLLTAESIGVDHRGNATLSREYMDRGTHRTVRWTLLPDSVNPDIAFMIAGHTVSNVTRSGVVTFYEYDAFGRQTNVWTESANGARTVANYTHYNNKGQVDWTEDAAGNRTSSAYDWRGRRYTTTDSLDQTTYTEYAGDGKLLATWGANYPVAYEYDAWGRMVALATTRDQACTNQNLWYLLGEGMLLSDTSYPDYPPELDTTLWSYDLPTGLLISKTYADGQGPSYTYTPDGKLASRTWARGVTTEYSYASCCNSLTNIAYSDDTPDVTYAYDRLGRITSAVTSGISTNLFEYDGLELVAETQNGIAITRATDSLGRPAGFTLGPDYEVVYGYDAYGRFQSVTSAQSADTFTYSYLPGSDLLSSMTNSSGFFWARTYEQQRNLIASVENRFNANLISAFDYANDSLARRTRRVDNLTVTNDFGYNVRSEVIGALMGTNRYSYAYDPIGNRMAATNNAECWTYLSNPLNQYTNIADGVIVEPEYDADGNMTATGDGWRYVWNGENRMILASNATTVVTYAYDHQGRMVAKTIDGSPRQYLWDGYNIVADARAACTNWFVWGLDLSGSLQGAGGVGGLLAEIQDGEPYFTAYDANGNVTEYISTNGVTEAHYEYSPFGEIGTQSGDLADSFTHRFSTKPWCGVTGLSEYLFRKYEPGTGRWMSRDPIGEFGGFNSYGYSSNNPLGVFDYLGLIDPRKAMAIIEKLLACQQQFPDTENWDAGIEYLLEKAYGGKWKNNLVKIADAMDKGLGIVNVVPKEYQNVKDVLDKLYPEGVPFDTKGLFDGDLSKIVSFLNGVQNAIKGVAVLASSDGNLTAAEAANLLSRVFSVSKSIGGSAPGIGPFMDYYNTAIKAAAKGIGMIEELFTDADAESITNRDCQCLTEGAAYKTGIIGEMLERIKQE